MRKELNKGVDHLDDGKLDLDTLSGKNKRKRGVCHKCCLSINEYWSTYGPLSKKMVSIQRRYDRSVAAFF